MRYLSNFAGSTVNITVDQGAEDNFIAKSVSKKLGLAEVVLSEPFDVEMASGKLLRLSNATHHLRLKIEEWKESFNIADIEGHEVILGIPWL